LNTIIGGPLDYK